MTCNSCMERDASTCSKTQTSQICALSSKSLGSSHCGSAVGKYRDEFGNFKEGFIRGCIECPGIREYLFITTGWRITISSNYTDNFTTPGPLQVGLCDIILQSLPIFIPPPHPPSYLYLWTLRFKRWERSL